MKIVSLYQGNQINSGHIKLYYLLLLCFAISAFSLTVSYFAEYVWMHEPCHLCKLQRIPYFSVTLLSYIAMKVYNDKWIYGGILFSFIIGTILASTHFLVQMEVIKEFCATPTHIQSLQDFEKLISGQPDTCTKIEMKLFGIPLSLLNFIISFSMSILLTQRFFNFKKCQPNP